MERPRDLIGPALLVLILVGLVVIFVVGNIPQK
jgi:hypothetical protein